MLFASNVYLLMCVWFNELINITKQNSFKISFANACWTHKTKSESKKSWHWSPSATTRLCDFFSPSMFQYRYSWKAHCIFLCHTLALDNLILTLMGQNINQPLINWLKVDNYITRSMELTNKSRFTNYYQNEDRISFNFTTPLSANIQYCRNYWPNDF